MCHYRLLVSYEAGCSFAVLQIHYGEFTMYLWTLIM